MKLMDTYRANQRKREIEAAVNAEIARIEADVAGKVDRYIEHMDLVILLVLHDDFGFGTARLRKYYNLIQTKYDEYKNICQTQLTKAQLRFIRKTKRASTSCATTPTE